MPTFRTTRFAIGIVFAATAMGAAHTSFGADLGSGPVPPAGAPAASAWAVSITPYGWLPFLQGDITVKGRTVDIDVTPFEVLDHLDAVPFMGYLEARRGALAFYSDVFFAKLGIDASVSRSVRGLTVGANADVDASLTILEAGGILEVARWSSGGGGGLKDEPMFQRYTAFDVLAGARYWHQDVDINFGLTGTLDVGGLAVSRSRAIARSGDVDWVDPLVGFRIRQGLAPGQELLLRADVGGFDVGSQFSWNVLGAYSFAFAVRNGVTYSGLLGYRALSVDFEKGSGTNRYEYDVVQHGPVVGLTIGF
jgi:hypothetical protein